MLKSILAFLVFILTACFILPATAQDKPSRMYEPYSVYSKNDIAPENYGDQIIVMFHGFLSAMPNGFYKKAEKALGKKFTVIGYNYDYFDVEKNILEFDKFYQHFLKGKILIFGGSSLGGFWADYFGTRYQVKKIFLSNPTVEPEKILSYFFEKQNYSDRREQTVTVTAEKLSSYKKIRLTSAYSGQRLIIMTEDDEIQECSVAGRFFHDNPNTIIIKLSRGGHSINYRKNAIAWSILETFIRLPVPKP